MDLTARSRSSNQCATFLSTWFIDDLRISALAKLWPLDNAVVSRADLRAQRHPSAREVCRTGDDQPLRLDQDAIAAGLGFRPAVLTERRTRCRCRPARRVASR